MKKVVLITGTSSGLGLETAVLFAKNNYTVYASMRNLNKQDVLLEKCEANNTKVTIIELDVTNLKSIDAGINLIKEMEGKIAILINNAGAGFAKTTEQATDQEMNWVFEVNYHSVVRCTKAVLPIMRKQKSGHIVNITSVGGLVGQPFNELYCAAKFAVEGYTEALSTYLPQHFGINLTAVEPGGIATDFSKSATQKTMGGTGLPNDEYLPIIQKYIEGMQSRAAKSETLSYQTAEEVAKVVLKVVQSEAPPIRIRTSKWAEDLCSFKTKSDPNGKLQNAEVIRRFL